MIQISLKTKLSLLIGLVMSTVMGIGSLMILVHERGLLISKHRDMARAIIQSHSVPVTNAFMFQEMDILPVEDTFDNYIEQIMQQKDLPTRFARILSADFQTVAHNEPGDYGKNYHDSVIAKTSRTRDSSMDIVQHPQYGWVLEVVEPLQISGKLWGYLVIGFDAETIRERIHKFFLFLLTTTILAIALTILVVYLISDRLTKSLKEMVAVIDKFNIKSYDVFPIPKSNDEIGFLARRFRQMQRRLHMSRRELEKAQKEIYHAEKLASIGRLASGVAHEINNPLMGLKNCVETLRNEPDNIEQSEEYLLLMQEGMDKIEIIVSKLLEFSHKKSRKSGKIDINNSIDRVLKLVNYRLSKNQVEMEVKPEDSLHNVYGDQQLLEEVFMNIIINAIDAMPSGGKVAVTTENIGSENILISFKDTGVGIPSSQISEIFDPFFTTKDIGKGTGLGLAVSLRIVEEHEGTITLKSNVGKGSTFFVQFPATEQSINKNTVVNHENIAH